MGAQAYVAHVNQRLKVKLSFYLPKARTNYFKNSFAYAAIELWGSLPSCSKKETFLQNSMRRKNSEFSGAQQNSFCLCRIGLKLVISRDF